MVDVSAIATEENSNAVVRSNPAANFILVSPFSWLHLPIHNLTVLIDMYNQAPIGVVLQPLSFTFAIHLVSGPYGTIWEARDPMALPVPFHELTFTDNPS